MSSHAAAPEEGMRSQQDACTVSVHHVSATDMHMHHRGTRSARLLRLHILPAASARRQLCA